MFTNRQTIEAARHRNDFLRSIRPVELRHRTFAEGEVRIRHQLREAVREYLKYTTRGQRGVGKTNEAILNVIRCARLDHTASIERQREWGRR